MQLPIYFKREAESDDKRFFGLFGSGKDNDNMPTLEPGNLKHNSYRSQQHTPGNSDDFPTNVVSVKTQFNELSN